jgi:hypothetical protein
MIILPIREQNRTRRTIAGVAGKLNPIANLRSRREGYLALGLCAGFPCSWRDGILAHHGAGRAVGAWRGESSMRHFHAKSFVLGASIVGATLMAGALCAPTAALAAAMNAKPPKKAAASVVVIVTNSRDVALTELDATPAGLYLPKKILSNLAPGKKASATVATDKDCVFDLHGVYADGSTTDSTSVDLCKDQNVNLVQ